MPKYTLGLDFGTLSARALLVELPTGREVATAAHAYRHGVMDEALPSGKKLPKEWALQHPMDYLESAGITIRQVLAAAEVASEDIVGVGIDFTSCTILPVLADGTPLCCLPEYENEPHAYVKLWKHHSAQGQADRINEVAKERKETWLSRYGGKISSEWVLPKILEIVEEKPEVYEKTVFVMEAGDWLIWQLTGSQSASACGAGYKALWNRRDGYPSDDFLKVVHPALENFAKDKLCSKVLPLGDKAGEVSEKGQELTGLAIGTPVAVALIDAHATVAAAGICEPGKMLDIIGTSACQMVLTEEEVLVPGICGVVQDGILPGLFGYEAGQAAVGDIFEWFMENSLPWHYYQEAKERNISTFELLDKKASQLMPGESGLIALDWWNGNRSVLVNANLSGMIWGLRLSTKPEEIYRALIEATAFGVRKIVETYRESGVPIKEFYAAGGIADKNPLLLQIYADVLQMPVWVCAAAQASALGASIFGAAVGRAFESVAEAVAALGRLKPECYEPDPQRSAVYDRLYKEYLKLHDYFGGVK